MPEFNINFAQNMSDASALIARNASIQEESDRATLYTALVACEIALKSALECAGKPLSEIPKTHNLSKLLDLVCSCTVLEEVTNGKLNRVPASRLRGVVVDTSYADATVGTLLDSKIYGASVFPNEIRYGDTLEHFPAQVIQKLSVKIISWVRLYADGIQT